MGNCQQERVSQTEAQKEDLMIETRATLEAGLQDKVAVHDACALLHGGVQAHILLDGQKYVLRKTRASKLILTK